MKFDHVEISYRCAEGNNTLIFNTDTISAAKKCFEGILLTRMNLQIISLLCLADDRAIPHPENIYYLTKDIVRMQAEHFVDCLVDL